jgi:hypothetical protein
MKALIFADLLLYLLYYAIEDTSKKTRTLEEDGFCFLHPNKHFHYYLVINLWIMSMKFSSPSTRPLMIERHSDDTIRGKIQSMIPLSYYNR